MTGKWKGIYDYDHRKGLENANLTPVEFDLEIIAFENGSFNGQVKDNIEMGGTPGLGQISGRLNSDHIVFEKNMPIETMRFQNGEQRVRKNRPHPTIVYSGKMEEDGRKISGKWKFKQPKFMWIGLLPWWYDLGSGTFQIRKTD
jgi:hypothetical protein